MAICYDVAPVGRYLKYRNQLSQNRMAEAAGKPILRIFLYIHIIVIMVIIVIVYHHAKTRVSVKFPLMKPNEALFFFFWQNIKDKPCSAVTLKVRATVCRDTYITE